MEVLALIIGRGGSKRLPRKNILPLGGLPLIGWSVECAKRSRQVTRIVCSTDSDEIAAAAQRHGAEVPFRRPAELAADGAKEVLAVKHAVDWLDHNQGYVPDMIVLLRAAAPFRRPATVDRAIDLLRNDPEAHSTRSVTKCREHPHKMWLVRGNRLISFVPEGQKEPEAHGLGYSSLPPVWVQNASFDVCRYTTLRDHGSTTGKQIIPVVMDEYESVDINDELDYLLAQALLEIRPDLAIL